MRKLLFIFALASSLTSNAQEPEFIGEVNIRIKDSTEMLDKEYMSTSSKADAGLSLFGVGSINTEIFVSGKNAKKRVPENTEFSLIARALDNNSDPMSVIRVFQFEMHHNSRRALVSKASVFGNSNSKFNSLSFVASKYGKSSYRIIFPLLPVGEYGVIVSNPSNLDGKSALIYCFGVGKPKAHSGWPKYNPDDMY